MKFTNQEKKIVKEYWAKVIGIPLNQFHKTSFKKVKNLKIYSNHDSHYGTLDMRVLKSGAIYYKIMGLIEGLSEAGRRPVFRDVS